MTPRVILKGRVYLMRQKFGQNFLSDKNIAQKIVNSANITKDDIVLEIGPGKGILTELILKKAKRVIAVEIDKDLCGYLRKKFQNEKKLKIVNNDFLKIKPYKTSLKFVSNLPFCSATAIMEKMFRCWNWESAIFTFQKEVGERILSDPGTKSYGHLTLLAWFYSIPEKLFLIKRGCFYPVPEVDSMVIKFLPKKPIKFPDVSDNFFKLVKMLFSNRRKTVLNILSLKSNIKKSKLKEILIKSGISPDSRPENISPERFLSFAIDFGELILYNKTQC